MNNYRCALRAEFTIPIIVISLFSLIGCEMQDMGISKSSAPPDAEVSFSVSAQSTIPSNPPAWDANTLYNRGGIYVSHKDRTWVSEWAVAMGAEPGKNIWNGWRIADPPSRDEKNPKPWDMNVVYDAKGFYVTHKENLWVSQWSITRGAEPGEASWNGWKFVPPEWTMIAGGNVHSLAVNEKGELYAWGDNLKGQLGDGTFIGKVVPTRIGTASNWIRIASQGSHNLAVNERGELYAWGENGDGQLGDGSTDNRNTPTRIGTASNWTEIAVSSTNSAAINSDGELYTWGSNQYGQLGNDTASMTPTKIPTRIGNDTDWKYVSSGFYFSMALKTNGELYGWGWNALWGGRLGDGTNVNKYKPTRILDASNWKQISSSFGHSLAVNTKGELYAWGLNWNGRLGDGTTTNRNRITRIGTDSDWKHVSAAGGFSMAIKNNGELFTWGSNFAGQLGDGTTTNRNTPTRIGGTASDWKHIAGGVAHGLGIYGKGELYAWGSNFYGEVGDGTNENRRFIPVQINHPKK